MLLLLPAVLTLLHAAEPADPASPPKLSTRLSEEIRSSLPRYVAPAATTTPADATPPDPDVLVLPKMTVKEKRLPTRDPDVWLGEKVIQQKAMTLYKASMTDFEWALNSWYIPILSAPASVRARAAYDSAKKAAEFDRLAHIINTVESVDPKEAAKLRNELQHDPDER